MAVAIAAGESHTCAVLADGTVRCRGENTRSSAKVGVNDSVRLAAIGGADGRRRA
ncbi:MAG: hypothetical protein HY744_01575 [Deltaproteobacteria bacterium]|nr:hypothetical protein [Deltaproteobacteria bacterium]